MEDDPSPTVTRAIDKLREIVEQLDAAMNGDEITNFVSGDDESGSASGSGSGESGGGNEIPDEYTEKPNTSDNGIGEDDENDNTVGGGVNEQPNAGLKKNSASRHVTGAWLLCSTMWVLSFAFRA